MTDEPTAQDPSPAAPDDPPPTPDPIEPESSAGDEPIVEAEPTLVRPMTARRPRGAFAAATSATWLYALLGMLVVAVAAVTVLVVGGPPNLSPIPTAPVQSSPSASASATATASTAIPSATPAASSAASPLPTQTASPVVAGSPSPWPTESTFATARPSATPRPTARPTAAPSVGPSVAPTVDPNADTDNDSYSNRIELQYGSDPLDANSTPESGVFGTCTDTVDNDLDGFVDAADPGCQ